MHIKSFVFTVFLFFVESTLGAQDAGVLTTIPSSVRNFQFNITDKQGKEYQVRPLMMEDINQDYRDNVQSDFTLPQLRENWEPLLVNQDEACFYGIFDHSRFVGKITLYVLPFSKQFKGALEYTRMIEPQYRFSGLGTSVLSGLILSMKDVVTTTSCPIEYLVSTIKEGNIGARISAGRAGMKKMPDTELGFYYSFKIDLSPQRIQY